MSRRLWFLIPGDPDTPTGGYVYDRRIAAGLADAGWRIEHRRLDESFPNPSQTALDHARQTLAEIPDEALVLIDGLALGAMPSLVRDACRRLRIVALVHHPLADETGLAPAQRAELEDSETRARAAVRGTIVTSRFTAGRLIRYGVPAERLRVVEPGVNPSPRAQGSSGDSLSLICVATLTERKGHDVLLAALAGLRDLPWRLDCIGDLDRDPVWSGRILDQCERLGLADRVQFTGALPPQVLEQRYQSADLAVLATRFEGYGMVVTEAVAYGLPMVLTSGGAAAETLPDGAGILVPVDDVAALRQALRSLLSDPEKRARLAETAWRAALTLPSWSQAVRAFSAVLDDVGTLPAPLDPASIHVQS
ncbi:glycosyltransferase family 4 protein [Thiorhodococcus fuscus]|uniref:Glycosyltransferase family 4 protein n=1 Tax=Thiorhodococcus fuscus TaxID=527200 RepID=A0ABW4Y261_9GAMM